MKSSSASLKYILDYNRNTERGRAYRVFWHMAHRKYTEAQRLISGADFVPIYIQAKTCDICGLPFENKGSEKRKLTKSVDRIDNSGDYTKENIRIVHLSCNDKRPRNKKAKGVM